MDATLQKEIMTAIGLDGLPEEDAQELLDRAAVMVMDNILVSSVEQLPDDQVDAYTALIATDPDPDTVFEFLRNHIEGFDDLVSNSVALLADAFKK